MIRKTGRLFVAGGFACLFITSAVMALEDGQARTPPMGWSSWNWFGCYNTIRSGWHGGVNEAKVIQMADAMVSSGMQAVGYRYINLDDCYLENSRNAWGGLVAKRATFPNGIKAVCDSVHKRGLKFGVYSCVFKWTCAEKYDGQGNGQPGMWGYEGQDCDTFVAWGVDYVKVDFCNMPNESANPPTAYAKIRDSIKAAVARARAKGNTNAHDMVFSICEHGRSSPWTWGKNVGHLWRTNSDIEKTFNSFMTQINTILTRWQYSGPGGWNDPDMMEVGNGMPANDDRVHFCLWSIMAAPMIAGNDLTNMNPATKALVSAPLPHMINQDSLGLQGRLVNGTTSGPCVISKKLRNGSYAVLFINAGGSAANVSATWAQIGSVDPNKVGLQPADRMTVTNVLTGVKEAENVAGSYMKPVPVHDAYYFLLSPVNTGIYTERLSQRESNQFKFAVAQNNLNVAVRSSYKTPFSLSVVDVKGACLQKMHSQGKTEWHIPVGRIGSGLYFVTMESGNKTVTQRLLIK